MASRFSSGSVIPFKAVRNSSRASMISTVTPSFRNKFATISGSDSRMRPFSMKQVLRFPPRAWCPSIVTVEESTPPDKALIAIPSPTVDLIILTFSLMNCSVFSSLAVISLVIVEFYSFKIQHINPIVISLNYLRSILHVCQIHCLLCSEYF